MADIIEAAKSFESGMGRESEGEWTVVFVDGESRKGTITSLSEGNYVMQQIGTIYFFNVDKVVRIM